MHILHCTKLGLRIHPVLFDLDFEERVVNRVAWL
jgi:hypothetical protein